ncbi:DUF2298 domain-containing protein [Jeongeupia chitinilytica]|uniref:Chlor_Arch_YYY domain-containing protein n=1 Tax=Jeongeupia chitinilytica TaxID=1041641 RepID=A0ABQ3H5D5_9NEIS|nr:DUF2298 domain-containing protein [Jeongeupia chitinilytica]GHD67819.1 hypothetical protein GCM10007350_32060 [Jeongeupia chitinilytica]
MTLIYYVLTLALILVHFAAVSAVVSRLIPSFHVARATGVLGITLACFFLEHFHGWGRLAGVWPFTTAIALLALWWDKDRLRTAGFVRSEALFWAFVGYGLMWKWFYPSIYPTSERVTDLFFIGNYLPGATLPPPDHWFPPRVFDFYYAFQHYGAALMGRLFAIRPGLTYNLAMPLLMAMSATLAWDIASRFIAGRALKVLLVVTLVLGATGASPMVHLVRQGDVNNPNAEVNDRMWASARFVGLYDQRLDTELAQSLYPRETRFEARELPLENFGYQYFVGDYHPPLGGFFLLLLALALMAMVETGSGSRRINTALIGLTVPVTIATNAWVFPLQALLVAGWAAWRHRRPLASGAPADPPADVPTAPGTDWPALVAGGTVAFLLLYPFLAGFASKSLSTPIRLVAAMDHTPLLQYLTLQWPLLLLIALGLVAGAAQRRTRGFTLYAALAFGALLLLSEFVFVDDPSGGRFERTNTVMKWWGWIWTGGLTVLGALLLGQSRRWIKVAVAASLALITLSYGWDTLRYLANASPGDRGRLDATAVYTQDPAARDLLALLARQPDGIVLENVYGDAYTDSNIFAAFTAKPSLLGWPSHLITWHGNTPEVWITRDQIRTFYAGTQADPLGWLTQKNVRYIVWTPRDAQNPQAWSQLQQAIAAGYSWQPTSAAGQLPVGLWVRRR